MSLPKVDFYILKETSFEAAYSFICRLIDKAYQQHHQIYLNTNSDEEANSLDDMLWTFNDISFVPHARFGIAIDDEEPPVQIGFNQHPQGQQDILINITPTAPFFFNHFKRVIEIVTQNETSKTQAREKYRYYKEKGCELITHDLTKK